MPCCQSPECLLQCAVADVTGEISAVTSQVAEAHDELRRMHMRVAQAASGLDAATAATVTAALGGQPPVRWRRLRERK